MTKPGKFNLEIRPVLATDWASLEILFGKNGACGGCWCMAMRLASKDFASGKGEQNRERLRKLVFSGAEPGLVAYVDGKPIAWCTIGPREEFTRLDNMRVIKPLPDSQGKKIWAVPCLFVKRDERGRGVSVEMLKKAAEYVSTKGADWIEGYPVAVKSKEADPFVWTGTLNGFLRAGYEIAASYSERRPIMRKMCR